MNLKKATLSAIVGICYLFVSRTTGTFFPGIFKNLLVAQVSVVMSFLAGLTIVVFFISFYQGYVQKEQVELKNASVLAIIGSSAMLLLHVKGLLLVFDVYIFPQLIRSNYFEPIIPWVSSILILLFFIVFHKEMLHKECVGLRKATLLAVIGSSITALLRTFLLFNYLCFREFRWFSDLPARVSIILLPVVAFSFFTGLYFFLSFYREQK